MADPILDADVILDEDVTVDEPAASAPSRRDRALQTMQTYGMKGNEDAALGMLAGGIATAGLPKLAGSALRTGWGALPATLKGAVRGAAENIPVLGPMGRGAIRGLSKARAVEAAKAAKAAEEATLKMRGIPSLPGDQTVHIFKDMPPNIAQIARTSQVAGLPAGQAADTGIAGLRNWILHNLRAK